MKPQETQEIKNRSGLIQFPGCWIYTHFSGLEVWDKIYFLNKRHQGVNTDNFKKQPEISVCSDPASAPWQDKDTDQGRYTQNVAHQAPGVQHPALSSKFEFA